LTLMSSNLDPELFPQSPHFNVTPTLDTLSRVNHVASSS